MNAKACLTFTISILVTLTIGSTAVAAEWNVGFQTLKVLDTQINRELDVALWYPTEVLSQEQQVGPATLDVALDAPPVPDSKGIIIISHGFSGSFLGHSDTAEYLAKNGYVVFTPTHPDQQGLGAGQPELDPLVLRPRHVQLLLDELLAGNLLTTPLATENIGIIGFSLGAYTALRVVGAEPDLAALESYCSTVSDELLCSQQMAQRFDVIKAQLTPQKDERIRAAVLLAPAYGPLFTEASVSDVAIPLQIYSAAQDEEVNNVYHAEHLAELLENQVEYKTIDKAGHYIFMSPCPPALTAQLPALCKDSKGTDRSAVHEQLNGAILGFFNSVFGQ